MHTAVLLLAVLMLGLMAGLFYAYAGSVMPGLDRAADRSAVDVMQRINIAIQNPLFLLLFMGSPVVTAIALFQNAGRADVAGPLLAALSLYAVTLVVTFAVNIPLNNRLDRLGDPAALTDPGAQRAAFFTPWVRWNAVRAVTSAGAFLAAAWALVEHGGHLG
ncbi:anthrone oxygenase family protein [Actinoplanes sp. NPDC023801]|uniref:anthrone oxygenase family protein n=1 Tax=Actinoplanes sp. NPDC023801 TaxID=3154595 RepID=UPI00340ECA47